MLTMAAALIAFTTVCFFAGAFFKPLVVGHHEGNLYLDILENLFFGLLVVVLVYSAIVTGLVTIMLAIVPSLAYLIIRRREKSGTVYRKPQLATMLKGSLLPWLPALSFLALQAYRFDYFNPELVQVGGGDFLYYAAVADNFHVRGSEGVRFNQFYSANDYAAGRMPYHYLDLWMISLMRVMFNIPKADTYLYIFIPFALTAIFLSTAAVMAESWKNNRNRLLLFIFSLLLCFSFVIKIPPYIINANTLNTPKFFICWPFVALLMIYTRRNNLVTGMLILCMLPVLNILGGPVVFTLVFATGCWMLFSKQREAGLSLIVLSVLTAGAIIAFYFCFSDFYVPVYDKDWKPAKTLQVLSQPHQFPVFRFFIERYYFFPLVLILAFFRFNIRFLKQEFKITIILIIIYCMSIVVAIFARERISDGFQTLFVPSFAIQYLLFALWIGYAMSEIKERTRRFVLILFVLLILVCNFVVAVFMKLERDERLYVSKTFLKAAETRTGDGAIIAYAYNLALRGKHPSVYHPAICYFNLQFPNYFDKRTALLPVSLPLAFDTISAPMHHPKAHLMKGDFAVFLQNDRVPGGCLYDQQLTFFNKFHIKYLLLDKGMDSISFYKDISAERITDPVSGITFCILRNGR